MDSKLLRLKSISLWCVLMLFSCHIYGQTITETYTDGDIPTNLSNFNDACNGPGTAIEIQLPEGGPWEVTGIDIVYDMTASGAGTMAEQRSLIYFQNLGAGEDTQSGSGSSTGTFSYDRENVAIANGIYAGETSLIFQMRAWRTTTVVFPLCNTETNKVDNNSWTITVHYQPGPSCIFPQNLSASSTNPTQAIVSWTEIGNADQWNIEYGPAGYTQGSGTPISGVISESHQISGLNPETAYDVYVQSVCGLEESSWIGPVSFTTPLTMAVEVTGFNEDVIANGVGTMLSSTTNIVDNDRFCFISLDWKLTEGSSNAPVGLPIDGVISNGSFVYKMSPFDTPYEGNNSLRISSNTSGTLTLVEPNNFETLYFLATSGSGSSNVSIEVNFDDATSQTFNSITLPDWYQTGLPVEISGFGRGDTSNNNVETPSNNPKLFRITAELSPANQGKNVTSITFTRNSGNIVNIFAVSGIDADACLAPTALTLDNVIDTAADISWEISYTESDGYSWVLMNSGDTPDVDTPFDSGTVSTGVSTLSVFDLIPLTTYDFYIKADCGIDGDSVWEGPLSFTTLAECPEPTNLQADDIAETTAEISWDASFSETDGYVWVLVNPGNDPDTATPVANGTTPTGQTNVEISDLSPGFSYDFYVKTDCGSEESDWSSVLNFSTLALAINDVYTEGDIPTNHNSFSATCNGPLTTLTVQLPEGGPWEVTGFDVSYDMIAAGGAWRSEQRSWIHFQNLDISEPGAPFSGSGNTAGTQNYNRSDINIANGYYAGEEELIFEMRAWRTWGGSGCNTTYNRVANNTWNITVYYQMAPSCIPPQDIQVNDIVHNQAEVSWTEIGDAESWNLEYGEAGFVLGDGTLITDIDTESFLITGLDPETVYDVYVWSDCGGGDESDWQTISFETLPSCPAPENVTLEDVSPTTAEFSWDSSPNETNGYIWRLMASGDNPDDDDALFEGVTDTGITSVEVIGLNPDTAFSFYVKADCGVENGESQWATVVNFSTLILSNPIEVAGLNADVIANGVGTMASSTTNDVDGVNFVFISEDWKLTESSPNAPVGLPENGIISSSLEGVFYQMSPFDTPYEGNNSLRIASNGTSGNLEFLTPAPYEALYFLVTSGSGASNITIQANFIDGTSQSFTSLAVSDWYNGTPFEAAGFGRGSLNDNNVETPSNNPRLYRITTNIAEANQTKVISSVTVTKNSGSGVVNVFAVTGKSGNPCLAPTDIAFDVLSDVEINVSWTPVALETGGYEWALMEQGEHPDTDTPVASGTTAPGVSEVNIDGLEADTVYDFYIISICTDGNSFWGGPFTAQTLPTCAPPSAVTILDLDENTIEASWSPSPHVTTGYNWLIMYPGEDPDTDTPIDSGMTTETTIVVGDLETNTDMVFFIQTDCAPTGESDWVETPFIIEGIGAICENPIEITSLPYTHTDNTSEYLNIYTGVPGTSCGTTNAYLNGFDVVYHLIAPENDLITIELADITGTYAGVFVYESCDDINTSCIAGAIAGNSEDDISIIDFEVTQGNSYYIIVSSWQSVSIDYTLNIFSFDCQSFETPIGEEEQSFVGGDTVADLEVEATMDDVTFTWYEDEDLTIVIADPTAELLVDGTTYYVTQTINVNGCESPALAILALEIDCTMLGITESNGDMLCTPGGVMTLSATAAGSGDAIYWYDAPIDGNLIGIGEELVVDVDVTTSFWVSEVYLEDGIGDSGPLPSYCTSFGFGTGCGGGDTIDDFILSDSSGNQLISHLGSGCSPNAYGDFTNDPNLTATLVAGQTYNFTATHNFSSQRIKIWIDFDKNGEFEDVTELLFSSPSGANPTNGSFTIPQEVIGNTTVMRVFNRYSTLPVDACTSGGSWGEVHDYKVTVVGASMLCASDPVEVIAVVNTEFPDAPAIDEEQFVCAGATLADIEVEGENIVWYSAAFVELPLETQVQNGSLYYVTQTVDMCESDYAAVTVTIMSQANPPTGSQNQTFVDGDTIEDLTVNGENLIWYADEDATTEIPTTTVLVDQQTYYVTQELAGFCESQTFGITVYQVLTIDEVLFGELTYYPNPVKNQLNIVNTLPIDTVEVFSVNGQKVLSQNTNQETVTLDLESLSSGVYFINIKIDDRTKVFRVVKE